MSYYREIESKLSQFYRRYYKNQLVKGALLFTAFGLSYFLVTSLVEYSFWLSKTGRTVLFWGFVLVELYLLFRFIGRPMLKLIKASKGISFTELSKIVGVHFSEVEDKLLNVLQLKQSGEASDLLLASIEKKSKELAPIPFNKAINYRINLKYVKYALAPILLVVMLFFTNLIDGFSNSFQRVLDYQTAYVQPAPFSFVLSTNSLEVVQGEDFTVRIKTIGDVVPAEAKIYFDKQTYFLKSTGLGQFEYTFAQVQDRIQFYVGSNGLRSELYTLKVLNTPRVKKVQLQLDYPNYTKQKDKQLDSPSNVIVPEGTKITWVVDAENTTEVDFVQNKKRIAFERGSEGFVHKKTARVNFTYKLITSNQQIRDYESLGFSTRVIKDEYPKIQVQSNIDSLSNEPIYFVGQLSDDYGVRKLQLVYQEEGLPSTKKTQAISVSKETLQSFFYDFPTGITLVEGKAYELYFEVFDNDGFNGSKKSQSETFRYRLKTQEEINQKSLEDQRESIQKLEKSLQNQKRQKTELQDIQNELQNKQNMNWNDKKKIDNLIKRQQQYQQMMEKQTNQLEKSLDNKKEDNPSLQNKKEELKKRIEELKKLKKQQKLLDELERLANKLDKEELIEKTKQLAQQNKQKERSLERILELTKRFYVEQKMTQMANKLEQLSKEQNKLSQKKENTANEQQKMTQKFDKLEKELEQLQKDNEKLKKPMDLPDVTDEQYEVNKEQQKAQQNLQNQQNKQARKNQKSAAKKMQQMSQKMQQSMSAMQANSIQENTDDLRKILKNLITFSFQQEDVMKKFEEIDFQHPDFGKSLRKQNQLKTYFEHIDDSLYVLSMRVPQISAKLQNDLADAHYNLDASMENFTERRFGTGTANQQYVMTAANNIADFLSDLLNNMNNSMSSSGKGKPSNSFSLPTLIQKQQGLSEQMKKGLNQKQGQDGKKKQGKERGQEKGNKQSEGLDGELYRIYQQQNQLKQQLQSIIREGNDPKGEAKKVVKSMEQLENEILEKGFAKQVLQRMRNLEYELLKLDKANLEQNKDKKRESKTNTNNYGVKKRNKIDLQKQYFKQLEILNRQSLPLRQNYKKKVQVYFSKTKKVD